MKTSPLTKHNPAVETSTPKKHYRIYRMRELTRVVGLCRAAIYNRLNPKSDQYDPLFPKPICLSSTGKGAIGWLDHEVQQWLENCMAACRPSDAELPFISTDS